MTKRKIRNDTPKAPRSRRTRVIYIRADANTVDEIQRITRERGHPHTFASVAGELLAGAIAAHAAVTAAATEGTK